MVKRCQAAGGLATAGVGTAPGSLDIVITTVNYTSPTAQTLDTDGLDRCEPRRIGANDPASGPDYSKFPNFGCDHLSSKPCCLAQPKLDSAWGKCVGAESAGAQACACTGCFDYRLRRAARTFGEVRYMLRAFEKHGLLVKSEANPDGVLRKIYIIYNDCYGNAPPAWLVHTPHVVAVPHSAIFPADAHVPSKNRNAIVGNMHRIPGLGPWFLYLEDDAYLTAPLDSENFFTPDGRMISYLTTAYKPFTDATAQKAETGNGYTGAMRSSLKLLHLRFGKKERHAEGAHNPKMFNTCVNAEMVRLWPEHFLATSKREHQHPEDVSMTVLAPMYMMDVGLAKNEMRVAVAAAAGFGTKSNDQFVNDLHQCGRTARQFIQVQGVGISDEYISEGLPPRGGRHMKYKAWLAWAFPCASAYEGADMAPEDDPGVQLVAAGGLRALGAHVCPGQRHTPSQPSQQCEHDQDTTTSS